MDFLEKALLNVAMGREKKSLLLSDQTKKITAYHEGVYSSSLISKHKGGHALVALKAKSGPEIRKATLVPRGGALGMVNYLPNDEKMVPNLPYKIFNKQGYKIRIRRQNDDGHGW